MENIENKKPENQKIFNFSFNKEEAKARLRALADNFALGISHLGLGAANFFLASNAISANEPLAVMLHAALGGLCVANALRSITQKINAKEDIKNISEAFGISEQEVVQILSESASKVKAQKATALQQPKPQTKDGGMER